MFELDLQSIMFFFIVINLFFLLLIGLLWSRDRTSKTLRSVFLANLFQVLAILLISYQSGHKTFVFLPLSNMFGVLQIVFWMVALLNIFDIKMKYWSFITATVISLLSTLLIQYTIDNISLIRAITSLMMVVIEVHTLIYILKNKKSLGKETLQILISIIGYLLLYHSIRTVIRFTTVLEINSIFEADLSVFIFTLIALLNNVAMMIILIYLHFRETLAQLKVNYDHDNLTQILTRKSFIEIFEAKRKKYATCTKCFAIMMLDLDDFKYVNDEHGHLIGDEVLKDFATMIKVKLRSNDMIGRYGGEEFIIMVCLEDEDNLTQIIERLFNTIRNNTLSSKELKITFSAGVAKICDEKDLSINEIIDLSDKELYIAKKNGKDQYSVIKK